MTDTSTNTSTATDPVQPANAETEADPGEPIDVAEDPEEEAEDFEDEATDDTDDILDEALRRLPIRVGRNVFSAEPTLIDRVEYRLAVDENIWSPDGFLEIDSWLWKPVPSDLTVQIGSEFQFQAVPKPDGRKWTKGWPIWGRDANHTGRYLTKFKPSEARDYEISVITLSNDEQVRITIENDRLGELIQEAREKFAIPAMGENSRNNRRFDGWYVSKPWARWISFYRWIKARNGKTPPRPMAVVRYELRQFRRQEVREFFQRSLQEYQAWIDSERPRLTSAVDPDPDLILDIPFILALAGREATKYVLGRNAVAGRGRHCSYHSSGLDDLWNWASRPRQSTRRPGEEKGQRFELSDFLPDEKLGRLRRREAGNTTKHCSACKNKKKEEKKDPENEQERSIRPAMIDNGHTLTVFAAVSLWKRWHLRFLTQQVFNSTRPYDEADRHHRRAMIQLTFGRPGTARHVLGQLKTLVGELTSSNADEYYRRYVEDPRFVDGTKGFSHDGHRRARLIAAEAYVYEKYGLPPA